MRTCTVLVGVRRAMSQVVVAVMLRDECRPTIATAHALATRLGARLTAVGCVPELAPGSAAPAGHPAHRAIADWVCRALPAGAELPRVAVRGGMPGIEIPRVADEARADLLVVGRCGDSAAGSLVDEVLRRSRRPCLVLPATVGTIAPILAALDGTERGLQVHERARDIAERLGEPLRAVTVEPPELGAAPATPAGLPSARSLRLQSQLLAHGRGESSVALVTPTVHVRTGDPVTEVLAEVREHGVGMLVVGWRWGGPSDRVPVGSVGRRLALEAPCAVLAVPI